MDSNRNSGTGGVLKDLLLSDEVLLDDSNRSPESSLDESDAWRGTGNREPTTLPGSFDTAGNFSYQVPCSRT
jgi:hypothetical protein